MAKAGAAEVDKETLNNILTVHAWSGDRKQVAVSPNSSEVHIYDVVGEDVSKWKKVHTLAEHDSFVSGIDWSPVTNLIVTCGHDRNAYVWKLTDGEWKPTLVILRINRAATCVKWSPDGSKFAVACGAKCVPVCHYEPSNNWWISKMIKKKFKSTVLSLDWHVNSRFLLCGSTDRKARIYSAYVKEIDGDPADLAVWSDVWKADDQLTFGEPLSEFEANSWVNDVAWSQNGFRFAYAGHNSTVYFGQILAGEQPQIQAVRYDGLPFTRLRFLNDSALVGAGWDCNPFIFTAQGDEGSPIWGFKEKLDQEKKDDKAAKPAGGSAFAASRAMFQQASSKGVSIQGNAQANAGVAETVLTTRHQNTVVDVVAYSDAAAGPITRFTTTGIDGKILFWDYK